MACNRKLVACLKVGGKVLREHDDKVYIPFSSEYSIYIKNLNSVRASVTLEIDGKNVFSDGSSLVVNPNSEVNIERWVNNQAKGNKFKYIERTSKIEDVRGIGTEDGILRIAFRYQKPMPKYVSPKVTEVHHHHYQNPNWGQIYGGRAGGSMGGPSGSSTDESYEQFSQSNGASKSPLRASGMQLNSAQGSMLSDRRITDGISAQASVASANALNVDNAQAISTNDKGITVAGTISNQAFMTVSSFPLEYEEHVMVLRMLGELGQNKIVEPVVVQRKIKCDTCGTVNKGSMKFCGGCGAAIGTGLVTA